MKDEDKFEDIWAFSVDRSLIGDDSARSGLGTLAPRTRGKAKHR